MFLILILFYGVFLGIFWKIFIDILLIVIKNLFIVKFDDVINIIKNIIKKYGFLECFFCV